MEVEVLVVLEVLEVPREAQVTRQEVQVLHQEVHIVVVLMVEEWEVEWDTDHPRHHQDMGIGHLLHHRHPDIIVMVEVTIELM